jgi:hypothetical protein
MRQVRAEDRCCLYQREGIPDKEQAVRGQALAAGSKALTALTAHTMRVDE